MLGLFSFVASAMHRGLGFSSGERGVAPGRPMSGLVQVLLLLAAGLAIPVQANPYRDTGAPGDIVAPLQVSVEKASGPVHRERKQGGEGEVDPSTPIIVEGPVVEGLTRTSALVSWKTQVDGQGVVQFGLAEDALDNTVVTTTAGGTQQVSLTNLAPGTAYFVRVETAFPDSSVTGQRREIRFTTPLDPDTQAPIFVHAPAIIGATDTALLVQWTTDEAALAEIVVSDALGVVQVVERTHAASQTITIDNLAPATDYELLVSATDTSGNRSTTTIAASTLAAADASEPVIVEGVIFEHVTDTSIHVRWQTSKPATSVVDFGKTQDLEFTQSLPGLRTEHHVALVGLDPGTTYGMEIASRDWIGNGPVESELLLLVTLQAMEAKAPAITVTPRVIGTTDTTATVYWETSEPSDSQVRFGTGSDRDRQAGSADLLIRHQVTLAGLEPGQIYGFTCASTGFSGLTTETGGEDGVVLQLTTAAEADVTPPVIVEGPEVFGVTDEGFTVRWTTDELAETHVRYGLAGDSVRTDSQGTSFSTEHIVTVRGLDPASEYELMVSSVDVAGNGPVSDGPLLVETGSEADETGPVFTVASTVQDIRETTALLQWETDELSSGDVAIGFEAGEYEMIQATPGLGTSHALVLGNLTRGTTYSYVIRATDQNQNTALSEAGQFTTQGVELTGVPERALVAVGENRVIEVRSTHPGDTSFLFSSEDPSVVTVNDRGVMTGVAEGRTQVLVTGIASRNTSVILVEVYTLQDPADDLSGFFALLGIFLIQDGSGFGGPCFIATAASGTPLSGEVQLLRQFRDEWLLTSVPGTMLVDAYYHVSPPLADLVAQRPLLALAVRILLLPVLLLTALWMQSPLLTFLAAAGVAWLVMRRRQDRRARLAEVAGGAVR